MGLFGLFRNYLNVKERKLENESQALKFENDVIVRTLSSMQEIDSFDEKTRYAKTTDADEDKWELISNKSGVQISETNLDTLRSQARLAWETNPLANNIIESSVDFVTGRGVTIGLSKLDDKEFPDEAEREDLKTKTTTFWETFKKTNNFDGIVPEFSRRAFRDGEFFLRWFFPTGKHSEIDIDKAIPSIRFIEPERIKDSTGKVSHGIEMSTDDYNDVQFYYLVDDDGNPLEKIPREEMSHVKIRADSTFKRGRSILFPVLKYLTYYEQWLKYRLILNKVRTAIVLIKTIKGSPTAIANLRSDRASTTATKSTKAQMLEPGTIITTQEGVDYKFMSPQLDARDAQSDGREIKLSIAAGVGFPEMLITSDFSNNTYSSSLTAQNPMIRKFQSWQTFFSRFYQEVFSKVIKTGKENWILADNTPDHCDIEFSPMIHRELKQEAEAYKIIRDSGAMSSKTLAEKMGLNYEQEKINMSAELNDNDSANAFGVTGENYLEKI